MCTLQFYRFHCWWPCIFDSKTTLVVAPWKSININLLRHFAHGCFINCCQVIEQPVMNCISQLRNPEQIRNQCRLTGFLITNSSTELICYKKKQRLRSFIMSGCPRTQNRTQHIAAGFTHVTAWMLSICLWTLVTCWYQASSPSFYILLDEGHGIQHHSVVF